MNSSSTPQDSPHDLPALSAAERARYTRQIGAGVLTEAGQLGLKGATAFVSRTGGMGGPASLMLTMAGVGHVILAHGGDLISADLNRQVLGSEAGLNTLRAPQFADHLRAMNRFVTIEPIDHEPDDDEAMELAARSDVILSCAPTFAERLRLNRAAASARIPIVDAAQWGMLGTLMVLQAGKTACLQCIYPTPPPFEELFPVVGAISSAIGSLAALEAIKILSGCGRVAWGKLLTLDGFRTQSAYVSLRRDPQCCCCSTISHDSDERT